MKQNLNKMMCLDLFLSGTKNNAKKTTEAYPNEDDSKVLPLISWDVFSESYFKYLNASKKALDLKKIKAFAKHYHWKNDIDAIFDENDFEAIIITDKNQNIIWVNEGFTTMTGYAKKEVLKKTPGFLQGKKTSKKKTAEIKFRLKEDKPFTTSLVNYRKNKSTYNCEVHIFPLYNTKTTHFIALEREVMH
ncbi:MAG: PAS domain-containing protein [Flavobacteriaceae bacterium]